MAHAAPGAQQWVPAEATVAQLRAAAPACRGCELWEPATQVVFSAGPADARFMLVGEQPGDQEDRQGVPFVGPAGRLLHEAMATAGIAESDVYLTNAVKHFRFTTKVRKRRIHEKPGRLHVVACQPWLLAELAAVRPEVVVLLGATAAQSLLGPSFRVTAHRGERIPSAVGGVDVTVLPTVHPSSVVRLRGKPEFDAEFAAFVADLAHVN